MNNCNRCVRSLTIYISMVVGIALFTTGAAGLAVIEKYQDKQAAAMQAVAWEGAATTWQEHVDASVEACGLALDVIASAMAPEDFDNMPLEVWQSAYETCLIDSGSTI